MPGRVGFRVSTRNPRFAKDASQLRGGGGGILDGTVKSACTKVEIWPECASPPSLAREPP